MRSSPAREEEGGGISPRQPVSISKRNDGNAATYAGRTYRSYKKLALELMPLTGRSLRVLCFIIGRYDGDGEAALRWCQTHQSRPHFRCARPPLRLEFDGRKMSRSALARELASRFPGASATAINDQLRNNGDDAMAVLRIRESAQITVAGITYPSELAFRDMLRQRYRVSPQTSRQWLRQGLTPDEALARARDFARRKRQQQQQRRPKQQRDIVLLGWRFSSFSALCHYYGVCATAARRAAFEEHIEAGKCGCWFPPIANRLGRLWEAGMLDQHNRWDQRTEARKPQWSLPRNSECLPITEPMEQAMLKIQTSARAKLEAWAAIVRG